VGQEMGGEGRRQMVGVVLGLRCGGGTSRAEPNERALVARCSDLPAYSPR
jgi:hypothetical protein